MKYNLSNIMRSAWVIFRKGVQSFAMALRMAWSNAKARFAMDLLWGNLIPDEDISDVSRDKLIITTATNNNYVEIVSDYLFAASQKMAELYKLCNEPEAS